MSSDRWQRLDRIFTEARVLPAHARADFVARECADETLRREALDLLAADDASHAFLAKPALEHLAQTVASEGWSLQPGERIGAYTIIRLLGAGGAGEVWRARDERLHREVAIKILLPHFSADADRLRRFAEEARTAGALNHSNILTVFDVGEHRGIPFIVSECLEGHSLRQRLETGALPADEAVAITVGIARGLAAAHARGIVHRDIKPENVFLRSDGVVKILDFGLAKLQSELQGPTPTMSTTMTGVIVGTAGYMAPEQITGQPVDSRTDLFALGVMLYEMLSGRNPFRRASSFESLHAILTVDPPDVTTAAPDVPPALSRVVMRLIRKSADARFQSAADLSWALEQTGDAGSSPTASATPSRPPGWRARRLAWLMAPAAAIALVAAAWTTLPRTASEASPLIQFTLAMPAGVSLASPPAVSPDSQHIAFAGSDGKTQRLYVRALRAAEAAVVAGSEGASQPFWSPDGRALGFFAGQQLLTVGWPGGAPVGRAPAAAPRGGTWGESGAIVFGPDVILSGLQQVPVEGGPTAPATLLDHAQGDTGHWWPQFLPGGDRFLYYVHSTDDDRIGVYAGRVHQPRSDDPMLIQSRSNATYVPGGDRDAGALVYVKDGRVEMRTFDPRRLTLGAEARAIDIGAGGSTLFHPLMLSATAEVLAFAQPALSVGERLEVVHRDGRRARSWDAVEAQNWPRVSPSGDRIARQRVDPIHNNPDIWIDDLARGTAVRLTTSAAPDLQFVWSPDGRQLAYVQGNLPGRQGERRLHIVSADGTGTARTLPCPQEYCEPTDWSPDGRSLLVNTVNSSGWDVWAVTLADGRAAPLLAQPFNERDARFSPDGRWIAYVSEEARRSEVSIRSISGPARRVVLSGAGGAQPVWRRDGKELFFVDPGGELRSTAISWTPDRTPEPGLPMPVAVPPIGFGHWGTQYDVSPDGSLIYLLRPSDVPSPREIRVIIGWRALVGG